MPAQLSAEEYSALDAVALSDLVRRRELSAGEVERAARAAVEAVDADLGALARPLFEPALVAEPHGVLGGVPFLIKDTGPFARGVPFAAGSRAIAGAVAAEDHPVMARFRAAGLVTIGQTTAPELSFSFATESRLYGITRNPWALDRGVGGSSGGAAALVAAGAVPIAHGSDGAGSIRIPASACGLVGLKPGRYRMPGGSRAEGYGHDVGVDFALTRTVRDTAVLLATVGSPDGSDWAADPGRDPGRLRIGVETRAWSGVEVDEQVAAAARSVARMLDWAGHAVEESSPPIDPRDVVAGELLGMVAAGAAVLAAPRQPDRRLLEAVSRTVLAETAAFGAERLAASVDAQERVGRVVDTWFGGFDLLVTPTLGTLPARHGELDYDEEGHTAESWLERLFEYGPFTAAFNVSGHPAISLPLAESREGLPIGVQLVAPRGREDLLLRAAGQLEQTMPWAGRQPPIFAG
jgi:amidase